jgi:hypothetical protein
VEIIVVKGPAPDKKIIRIHAQNFRELLEKTLKKSGRSILKTN